MVLKIHEGEDGVYRNVDDAIQYIQDTGFKYDVSVFDLNSEDAYDKMNTINNFIKEYNKGKKLHEQILPSNPQYFRGIIGCLGVVIFSITLGKYEDVHNLLSLTGFNRSVLDNSGNEDINITPSLKSLSTLATMVRMYKYQE